MIEVPLVMVTASVKVAPQPRTGPPSLNEAKGVSAGSGIELSEMKMPTLAAQITIGDYAVAAGIRQTQTTSRQSRSHKCASLS